MPTRPPRHNPRARAPAAAVETPRPRVHENRPSARKRGYDRQWEKARDGYLAHHQLCVHCLAEGIVTASTVVDHIQPHRGDMRLFWDSENNWQALCRRCHSKKTAKEDGGFGNKRKDHGSPTHPN